MATMKKNIVKSNALYAKVFFYAMIYILIYRMPYDFIKIYSWRQFFVGTFLIGDDGGLPHKATMSGLCVLCSVMLGMLERLSERGECKYRSSGGGAKMKEDDIVDAVIGNLKRGCIYKYIIHT